MSLEFAYQVLFGFALLLLTMMTLLCLVRCILGPRISDRVLAINMIGTLTVIMVGLFVVLQGEGYLADIALIYAMISLLAVVLLCKVFIGIYHEHKHEQSLHVERGGEEAAEK